MMGHAALGALLPLAVDLELRRLLAQGGPHDLDLALLPTLARDLAEHGDVLLYGGRRGEAARQFVHLARGIAILAFAPGGVTLRRLHLHACAGVPDAGGDTCHRVGGVRRGGD